MERYILVDVTTNFLFEGPCRTKRTYFFFFSWLNTTLTENRTVINSDDLDGFDKVNAHLMEKLELPEFPVVAI